MLPYGSSARQVAPFGICLLRISQGSLGSFCHCQPRPPAGRASHLGEPTHGHLVWTDCTARSLRLPQPTWRPPTTQNSRRVQLPPPPPKTDSASTTDQSQQTTPWTRSLRDKEPSDQGEPGHMAVFMDPPHRWPHQPHTSQPAPGRSGGAS